MSGTSRGNFYHFKSPVVMVMLWWDRHYTGKGQRMREVPISRVPVQERTGALRIVLASEVKAHNFVVGQLVYPGETGLFVEPKRIVEVYVEVLPRGKSRAYYADIVNGYPRTLRFTRPQLDLSGPTPLFISREAAAQYGGWVGKTDGHTTFMPREQLGAHLAQALPLIGVPPGDLARVTGLVQGQWADGIAKLQAQIAHFESRGR